MILHFPSVLLLIGYVCFWLELYVWRLPGGRTSLAAFLTAGFFLGGLLWRERPWFFKRWSRLRADWAKLTTPAKALLGLLWAGLLGITLVTKNHRRARAISTSAPSP